MPDQRLRYLFHRWFDKTASDEERTELMALLKDQGNDDEVRVLLEAAWRRLEESEAVFDKARSEDMLRRVLGAPAMKAEPAGKKIRPVITMRRAAAAAVILLTVGTGAWFRYFSNNGKGTAAAPVAGRRRGRSWTGGRQGRVARGR